MTVIAALSCPDGSVVLGADSRTTAEGHILPFATQKWHEGPRGWWLGMSGAGYQMQVLGRVWADTEMAALSVAAAVERLRTVAETHKFFRQAGDDYRCGVDGLIVARGCIFDLDSGLCCRLLAEEKFWARGSGCDYAIGAAHAMLRRDTFVVLPTELMKIALETACHWNAKCGGELFIRKTRAEREPQE